MKNILNTILLLFVAVIPAFSQAEAPVQDMMHSMGRFYVVVGVIVVIFIAIVLYVDNQIKKNE